MMLTGSFPRSDAVHTLTCALMLLNTDLHGQVSHKRLKSWTKTSETSLQFIFVVPVISEAAWSASAELLSPLICFLYSQSLFLQIWAIGSSPWWENSSADEWLIKEATVRTRGSALRRKNRSDVWKWSQEVQFEPRWCTPPSSADSQDSHPRCSWCTFNTIKEQSSQGHHIKYEVGGRCTLKWNKFSLTECRKKDVVCAVHQQPGRTERRPGFSQGPAQSKLVSDVWENAVEKESDILNQVSHKSWNPGGRTHEPHSQQQQHSERASAV